METVKYRLTGLRPLLMHNARLSNPTDPLVREMKLITKKGAKKTDEDIEELKWLEWRGGLYTDEKGMIAIPSDWILAAVIEGARKRKEGKGAQAGVFENAAFFPLKHDLSNDPKKLLGNERAVDLRSVRNQQNRVMRARPIFRNWSVDISLTVNPEVIDLRSIDEALTIAGERIGLGDYRPRFGRFTVKKI